MSKKKKAVAKMSEKVEPTYYTTLNEEQFDVLDKMTWDNPLDELRGITDNGELTMLEIGFKIGQAHIKFEEMISKMESILNDIRPEPEFDDWDQTELEEEEFEDS